MSKKVGVLSSIVVSLAVILFAIGMLIPCNTLSYFVCIILSWGYVMLTCAFATEVSSDRKVFAYGGVAFACIYAVIIDLVYFTQLTTVAHGKVSEDIISILSYESLGSWMFNIDLFGYGMMALSTLFIGMTIQPRGRADRWLKGLLMVHGVFVISCVLFPILNVFGNMGGGGDIVGVLALLVWCAYFLPIGILSIIHFNKS